MPTATAVPLWLTSDIRDLALLHSNKATQWVLVTRNNDKPGVFALNAKPTQ